MMSPSSRAIRIGSFRTRTPADEMDWLKRQGPVVARPSGIPQAACTNVQALIATAAFADEEGMEGRP